MAWVLDIAPNKTEFLSRTRAGNLVPVSCELPADLETPISVFLKLRGEGNAFLLESVEGGERIGRYSFIGSGPLMTVIARGNDVEVRQGSEAERRRGDVLEVARELLGRHRLVGDPSLPRFSGGAVGYFGFSGNMDMAIAIRTAVCREQPSRVEGRRPKAERTTSVFVQAGGGIVADSDPDAEFAETENKAKAVLRALETAERGLG